MSRYELVATPFVTSLMEYDAAKGQSHAKMTRCTTMLFAVDLGCREVRLCKVSGYLDNEINEDLLDWCVKQGYEHMQCEVPTGTPACHHLTKQFTRGGLDRYTIDLTQWAENRTCI